MPPVIAPPDGDADVIRGAICVVKEANDTEKSTEFWLARTLDDMPDEEGAEAVGRNSKFRGVLH